MAKKSGTPVFLLLNKIDLLRGTKDKLLPIIDDYRKLHDFREIIPLSARKSEGLDVLLEKLIRFCPKVRITFLKTRLPTNRFGSWWRKSFANRFWWKPSEEVPYATTVVIEQFEEETELTRIAAAIFCERDGQKGILVGKGGQMLKKIGTAARLQIEKMWARRCFSSSS